MLVRVQQVISIIVEFVKDKRMWQPSASPSTVLTWWSLRPQGIRQVILFACSLWLVACVESPVAPPKRVVKDTFPVTGRVLIDGEPVEKLLVTCHDTEHLGQQKLLSLGLTDENGDVTFSTFEGSDGVPAGEYLLTFSWRDWDNYWNRFEGPDKFKGRYSEPAESQYRLLVTADEPADLGVIELTIE